MGIYYCQLTDSDRLVLERELIAGRSQRSIAKLLAVSASTVCREIKRVLVHGLPSYVAAVGQCVRQVNRERAARQRRKLDDSCTNLCWRAVMAGLRVGWSPQQIAGRLKVFNRHAHPSKALPYVSHETIYCAIYAQPRGTLRTELVKLLRNSHAGRLPRARKQRRAPKLQDMTPIALRPPEVAARIVPGHWEGDLIKGARGASAVGTLVERTSRYLMLTSLPSLGSTAVLDAFTQRLRRIPTSLRKTLTYDQGSEMAQHATLAKRLRIDVYFCDAHSPWQRGTNENANGLIREYLPKGTDLKAVCDDELAAIEQALNNRPRKILGFRTPAEVFAELKRDHIAGVALQP
jgi:transposase, IS30 family